MLSSSSARFDLIQIDAEGTDGRNMPITHLLRGVKDYGTSYLQEGKKSMNKKCSKL